MPTPIEELVKHIRDLPSMSAVVVELLASMEQEDIDVIALGAKIALDQSLTAKTLRLANSSFYGMPSKVTSIRQAISVLGFHSIRTLVTACALTSSFPERPSGVFDFKAFWRHSVATAVCAKLLAPRFEHSAEAAFTAGLLHDIGKLVLATSFPADYGAMLAYRQQHDCFTLEAERAVFGFDHAVAGSALAGYWKFPLAMQAAVANHHQADTGEPASLALVVHVANIIAHALDLSGVDDDLVPPISQAAWQALALDQADSVRLFAQAEASYAELCQILVA